MLRICLETNNLKKVTVLRYPIEKIISELKFMFVKKKQMEILFKKVDRFILQDLRS